MKISKPKIGRKSNASQPYGNGGAQHVGQVKSGHHHLSIPAGGAAPSFTPGTKKSAKVGRKMY